jgi:hypothetical protein
MGCGSNLYHGGRRDGAQGVLSIVPRLQVYRPKKLPFKKPPTLGPCQPPATNVFPNFLPNSFAIHLGHERV